MHFLNILMIITKYTYSATTIIDVLLQSNFGMLLLNIVCEKLWSLSFKIFERK